MRGWSDPARLLKIIILLTILPVTASSAEDAKVEACVKACDQNHTSCDESQGGRLHQIACGVRSLKCIAACRGLK